MTITFVARFRQKQKASNSHFALSALIYYVQFDVLTMILILQRGLQIVKTLIRNWFPQEFEFAELYSSSWCTLLILPLVWGLRSFIDFYFCRKKNISKGFELWDLSFVEMNGLEFQINKIGSS